MKTNLAAEIKTNGFCRLDMSADEYHAHENKGSTTIARARRSWAHALTPFESTPAMAFGSGFHVLVGEPTLFAKRYARAPDGIDRRTKEGKAAWAEFLAANRGKITLTAEEWEQMNGMLSSILSNDLALRLLTGGVAESSYFWTDEETGVGLKCRPDYYRANGVIVDLKTAEDASESAFVRTLLPYGRHIQTALYLDGLTAVTGRRHDNFVHLVIEKKPPYGIAVYRLDDDSIEQGRNEYRALIKQYSFCQQIGEFPSYPKTVKAVRLPEWGFRYE
jgi:hypothetical protein